MARQMEYEQDMSNLEQGLGNLEGLAEHFENRTKELDSSPKTKTNALCAHWAKGACKFGGPTQTSTSPC